MKNSSIRWVLTLAIVFWKLGTQIPKIGAHLGVWVFILTLSYTLGSMRCDSQASLLARALASLCFGREPKARVVTSTESPKVKTSETKGVGVRSLVSNISGVEGHVGTPGWGLGRLISKWIIHTHLHKPNNKLVNA
jgi:hypothetical protein